MTRHGGPHSWLEERHPVGWDLCCDGRSMSSSLADYTACLILELLNCKLLSGKSSWSRIHERTVALMISGHNLERSQTWGFRTQCLHYKLVSSHFCSGGGGGKILLFRWLWIANGKSLLSQLRPRIRARCRWCSSILECTQKQNTDMSFITQESHGSKL